MNMTEQDEATKALSKEHYHAQRRMLDTLRFTWETVGFNEDFIDLVGNMLNKKNQMESDGKFEAERFESPIDGDVRMYTVALLEIAKGNV